MRGWDSVAMVDWSGGNDRGPRPVRDAIWVGTVRDGLSAEPVYLRNRQVALEHLKDLIDTEVSAGRRLLIGFDFPFGYPKGFAAKVVGAPDPLALWTWFATHLEDSPTGNNRFDLAGRLNRRELGGHASFWFNGTKRDVDDLPRRKADRRGHRLPERRMAEEQARGTFTCWQMGGAGAVGGQVMTGLATLARLRAMFPGQIAVWPFEPLDRPVAFVEVWPSLIAEAIPDDPGGIKDRAQVETLARAISHLSPGDLATLLDIDAPEEGWIFGLGHERTLKEAACRT